MLIILLDKSGMQSFMMVGMPKIWRITAGLTNFLVHISILKLEQLIKKYCRNNSRECMKNWKQEE